MSRSASRTAEIETGPAVSAESLAARDTALETLVREAAGESRSTVRARAKAAAEKRKAAEAERRAKLAREAAHNLPPDSLQAMARRLMLDYGYGPAQWHPLDNLIARESGWNPRAENPTSGAYGLPQALPGSKMSTAGSDWRTNPRTQIIWMLGYIDDRYGTPANAWAHSERVGWY